MYINHAAGELYFATLTVFADNFWYGNEMITFLFSTIKLCTMAITTRDVLAHMGSLFSSLLWWLVVGVTGFRSCGRGCKVGLIKIEYKFITPKHVDCNQYALMPGYVATRR